MGRAFDAFSEVPQTLRLSYPGEHLTTSQHLPEVLRGDFGQFITANRCSVGRTFALIIGTQKQFVLGVWRHVMNVKSQYSAYGGCTNNLGSGKGVTSPEQ